MGRNRGYQRYRGFRWTPRELRYGMGLTRRGLRCTRVRVRCGKTRPAVYPCGTLTIPPPLTVLFWFIPIPSAVTPLRNAIFSITSHLPTNILDLVVKPLYDVYPWIHGFRGLLGSTFETGWDNLASQAATTEWQGERTYVALVALVRFD